MSKNQVSFDDADRPVATWPPHAKNARRKMSSVSLPRFNLALALAAFGGACNYEIDRAADPLSLRPRRRGTVSLNKRVVSLAKSCYHFVWRQAHGAGREANKNNLCIAFNEDS